MMANPVLSIIIPTRERAGTLAYTLASALDQTSQDFEVVIGDNASEDDTSTVVSDKRDSRIQYFRSSQRLSMCDNYEFALNKARGEYVIVIGDDDATIPGMPDILLVRLRALAEPVIHMWPLHIYDWPVDGRPAKATYIAPERPESILDLKAKGRRVVELGGWKYYELPSPYHAAIPRRILDALRQRTGRVFHSTQPDVFTAMAIPAFADQAINIGTTVTLNGRSAKSNGLGFVKRGALPNIERFISEYGDYEFHPSLFDGTSAMANMIPDAVLKAKDFFPEVYGDVAFNYSAMWAYVARLRFAKHGDVIAKSASIGRVHPLNIAEFVGYSLVHEGAAARRTLLNSLGMARRGDACLADNVHDFAKMLATSASTGNRSMFERGHR
jgi:glycosyltransferase involved in cell wall biosynthesis